MRHACSGQHDNNNRFIGAGKLLGGLLLTTRRTKLLGALVSFGVLGQVAMLNFSYDVPVNGMGKAGCVSLENRGAQA